MYLKGTMVALMLSSASISVIAQPQVQPMQTRYAATLTEVTVDGWFKSFKGVELDEVEDFDGWTAGVDVVMPFKDKFQLVLSLPLRTSGDATVKIDNRLVPGKAIDIEGNGGIFDFGTLAFEHQVIFAQQSGYDLSYYVGLGRTVDALETDITRPNGGSDKINHRGKVVFAGIKIDSNTMGARTLTNIGLRYYDSDDLNPGDSDQFVALDARGAIIFSPWGAVHPVLELTYLGDFRDLNQFSVIPELIFPVNDHLELKAGAEIGLGGSGNELGGQAEVSVRF